MVNKLSVDGLSQKSPRFIDGECQKKDNDLTRKAKNMIHCSLENVLRLDDICRELDISKFKFIRMVKAGTGISPYHYFLNCKLELAKQLIEKNKDVYSAVAEYGFVDLTHLNKHFKSIYGNFETLCDN